MSKEQRGRVEEWITKLEAKADELLDGIELEDLTVKERFELALKCIGHTQRFIMINQQLEGATPEGQTNIMIAAIMRRMRGEISTPDLEGNTVDQ